jgi:hypothetical protein
LTYNQRLQLLEGPKTGFLFQLSISLARSV